MIFVNRSLYAFGHRIVSLAFEKRSCQIFTSSGEIVVSWLPWPGVPGAAAARACAGIGRVRKCVWGRFDPSEEKRERCAGKVCTVLRKRLYASRRD